MRTRSKRVLAAACLAGATLSATLTQAADPNPGRDLAATCGTCHGTAGHSMGGMARLAGEPRERLLAKLKAYAAGQEPATVMGQIAKGYSEAQLELIAAWFAAQPREQGREP
jgi:cytochrome subunit of sulfide dehydrogenase